MAGLYFHIMKEAVKEAKLRARTSYTTCYIYQDEKEAPNLRCSLRCPAPGMLKAKVLYDGSITYFGKAEEPQDDSN